MTGTSAKLRACAEDPMWAAHAEVSKALLMRAAHELESALLACEAAYTALRWISDCYADSDDDAGECASCHERSYKPHAPTCKKQNALKKLALVLGIKEPM